MQGRNSCYVAVLVMKNIASLAEIEVQFMQRIDYAVLIKMTPSQIEVGFREIML